jgi:nitrite reductase/ring-hydroxylating ferredoxin subunit
MLYDHESMGEFEQKDKTIKENVEKEKDHDILDIASIHEVPAGKMKHFEVDGKEILIANIDGKIYALSDRCGHANASLSRGNLNGKVVTCPLHGARFDVTTGKKIQEPNLIPVGSSMDNLPEDWKKYAQYAFEIGSYIKTYDQEKYEAGHQNGRIIIKTTTPQK